MIEHFLKPESITEALKLKEKYENSVFLAGGTEVNTRMIDKVNTVISLETLKLDEISETDNELVIGSMVTLTKLVNTDFKNNQYDALTDAALKITNRNIRNQGTLGGNVASLKPSSDMIPILSLYDANLVIHSKDGVTEISLRDYLKKGKTGLIEKIIIRKPDINTKFANRKFTRTAADLPIVNLACSLTYKDKKIVEYSVAAGSVSDRTIFSNALTEKLNAMELNSVNIEKEVKNFVKEQYSPIDDIRGTAWYKSEIVGVYIIEILVELLEKNGVKIS